MFKVDDEKNMNEKRCESLGTVSIHSAGGKLNSGSNILITGLCYWPGIELRCEFGDVGTAKGYKVNETKAICTVPLLTTRKQQSAFYIYPNENSETRFAREFDLEPVFLDDAAVQRKTPETWTTGNRVNISWDFSNLASDLSVTIEIINLFYNQSGIEFHDYTTVVFSQPNTGKAEFDLPLMENLRKNPNTPKMLQMVRVRSLIGNGYNRYVPREWIGSELFLLTNQTVANGSCSSWLQNQSYSLMKIAGHSNLTPCPKTRRQMNADNGLFRVHDLCNTNILPLCKFYFRKVDICYKTIITSDQGIARTCCYDNEGELTAGPPGEFVSQAKHAVASGSILPFIWDNKIVPYLQCCMFSNNCLKYEELTTSEARYLPPNIGAAFGDPHIQTLDGVEYTFNGFGEYTVLNVNNTQFLLQGRMQPLKAKKNGEAPATVFTAFAMKEQGSSLIQVQQNEWQSIDVLVDGKLIALGHELQSKGVFIKNSTRENNPRVILAFNSGITVYVENAAPVLQMAVVVPVRFKGKTSGLLGYWDDNSDKEYFLPNREFLNTATTMSELHYKFGQQWLTNENNSLFIYGPEEAHMDFFDPSYIPTFMEGYDPITSKMNSGMKKRALNTCEHSFQCIFDIAITGRFGIGQATKEFQEWLTGMTRDLHDEGCNVVLRLGGGSVRREVLEDHVTYNFTCNHGYIMIGGDKISCHGGVWDGSKPTCSKASPNLGMNERKGCEQFSTLFENGHFTGQGNKAGDRYKFQCDSSYILVGEEEIVCENGEWSGKVPSCQAKCSQITINNSQVTVGIGGQLSVQCNSGYTLSGSKIINCGSNGLLNGTLPSCTKDALPKASVEKKDSMIVIVVGVLVLFVAILVIMLTIYLVRKHHRRKDTQVLKKPDEDERERVAV
ncbi:Sushi domain-containing protein 2 [Stylophora pistillata]|uniref:Sushi domain-containing protein 2 n=2 Tax=Stylophora pistillata TaxID=50429 RepID=A0A2B4RKG1_STYPI|nr:Sushi domain-containing protein 2 [Stylophora pistillata]